METTVKARGLHAIVDLAGCPSGLLGDQEILTSIMREAANKAQATIMKVVSYRLGGPPSLHPAAKKTPDGISVYVGLDESHVTCHTYQEDGLIAIDIFVCGRNAIARAAVGYLLKEIPHKKQSVHYINRFVEEDDNE